MKYDEKEEQALKELGTELFGEPAPKRRARPGYYRPGATDATEEAIAADTRGLAAQVFGRTDDNEETSA